MQEAGTVHRLEPGGFRTDICFLQKIIRKDIRVDIKAGMVAEKKDIEVRDPLLRIAARVSLRLEYSLEDDPQKLVVILDRFFYILGIDTGVMLLMVGVLQMQHVKIRFFFRDQIACGKGDKCIDAEVVEGLALLHVTEELRTQAEGRAVVDELDAAEEHALRAGDFRKVIADLLAGGAGIHHRAGDESFFIGSFRKRLHLDELLMRAPLLRVFHRVENNIIEQPVLRRENTSRDTGMYRICIRDK